MRSFRLSGLARILGICLLLLFLAAFVTPEQAEVMRRSPSTFGTLICSQFWYMENKLLAEGRVCLETERARKLFHSPKPCLSGDEKILDKRVRDYLRELRAAARAKGCPR